MKEKSIFIAGAAGEGIQTIGDVVAQSFLLHGYPVFTYKEFESRIRGGNSSYRLRVADRPVNAPCHHADILLAINPRAREHYLPRLRDDGALITSEPARNEEIDIPFAEMAQEVGGSKLYANAVAAGALCAAVGLPIDALQRALSRQFARHGPDVVQANVSAAQAGYDRAVEKFGDSLPEALPARETRYFLSNAHETLPLAAAAAGCRFMSAYPMSPSTGIITELAKHEDLGVFTEQAESEIAAINMALGASAAGARAMTATSGGGFALMVESLSLAGMTETPLVIVLAQRPGPATGLPTRTAQEDLSFVIHAGHGEFPRLVLAPADPQDAIDCTIRAFDLADRYQIPVIVLTDQFLADAYFSLETLELPEIPPAHLADPESIDEPYARYAWTDTGISPRLYFGQSKHLVSIDSDEHTPAGHITEDLRDTRPAMVEKRLEKWRRLQQEADRPKGDHLEEAEVILIGWGSTRGAIAEAAETLRERGRKIGTLHFRDVWPLPAYDFPKQVRYWTVEGNATGQFARLLRAEYGVEIETQIGRYDGLPMDAETILKEWS